MPAVTSLTIAAAKPAVRVLAALAARAMRKPKRVGRALKNRHHAMALARLDDRMLADIGLTRADLRDAYSDPLWKDPTETLVRRADERRLSRRRKAFERSSEAFLSPRLCGSQAPHYPSADRPASYLV